MKCPKCDSTDVRAGENPFFCDECGWMSRKMILARTGPELNTLIATKIMGWVVENPRDGKAFWRPENSFCTVNEYMAGLDWSPSSDMKAAMGDVVRKMTDRGYQLELRTYQDPVHNQPGVTTGCRFLYSNEDEMLKAWRLPKRWHPGDDERAGHADTIPLAICRAALVAVNVNPVDAAYLRADAT